MKKATFIFGCWTTQLAWPSGLFCHAHLTPCDITTCWSPAIENALWLQNWIIKTPERQSLVTTSSCPPMDSSGDEACLFQKHVIPGWFLKSFDNFQCTHEIDVSTICRRFGSAMVSAWRSCCSHHPGGAFEGQVGLQAWWLVTLYIYFVSAAIKLPCVSRIW